MIREWWDRVNWRWGRGRNSGDVAVQEETAVKGSSCSVVPLRQNPDTAVVRKKDSAEVFQEAVEKLVDRLEQINAGISLQIQQNEQLVDKMNQLPDMLSSLPQQSQEQRQILQELTSQLKAKSAADRKMLEIVGEMTEQAAEQTHKLRDIHEHLQTSAKTNRQLCDNMGRVGDSLNRLNADTNTQTEWIQHLSRSLAVTDQYLKFTLARQQSRFLWVFAISVAVSLMAIAGLALGMFLMNR
jgi:Mg2+ and Co2+ transporter CorA